MYRCSYSPSINEKDHLVTKWDTELNVLDVDHTVETWRVNPRVKTKCQAKHLTNKPKWIESITHPTATKSWWRTQNRYWHHYSGHYSNRCSCMYNTRMTLFALQKSWHQSGFWEAFCGYSLPKQATAGFTSDWQSGDWKRKEDIPIPMQGATNEWAYWMVKPSDQNMPHQCIASRHWYFYTYNWDKLAFSSSYPTKNRQTHMRRPTGTVIAPVQMPWSRTSAGAAFPCSSALLRARCTMTSVTGPEHNSPRELIYARLRWPRDYSEELTLRQVNWCR